jgi:hypothetical protein
MPVIPTSERLSRAARAPTSVSLFNPILKFLLATGVPLGPNGLITIRGRKSGMPRTTPVAIIQLAGRRWVWAPWGEVNGCAICALRAAPRSRRAAGAKKSARPSSMRRSESHSFATFSFPLRDAHHSVPCSFGSPMVSTSMILPKWPGGRRVFEIYAI